MITDKKTVVIRVISLVTAVFLFFSLSERVCAAARTVYSDGAFSVGYAPDTAATQTNSPLEHFADGEPAELLSPVVRKLEKSGKTVYSEELYEITPVIFVRSGVWSGSVSWREALSGRHKIIFPTEVRRTALILTAAAFVTYGGDTSCERMKKKLSELAKNGCIVENEDDADIAIGLDFETHAGFVPVIPEEGTVAFKLLLASQTPFVLGDADRAFFASRGAGTAKSLSGGRTTDGDRLGESFSELYFEILDSVRRSVNANFRALFGANGYTAFTVVCLFLLILQCAVLARRSMQKSFSRCVVATGVMVALWITSRFVKWQTDGSYSLNRYLWYSFYIYFIFLPLLLLLMASKVGVRDDDGKPPRFWCVLAVAGAAMLACVLTNDLHSQVFVIDKNGDYTYGPLYFVISAFIAAVFVASLAILYIKCLKSIYKPSILYPAALTVIPFVYWLLYVCGVPFASTSDITLAASFFIVFSYEAVLRTGLVPCNVKYRALFRHSRLGLQIVGNDGKTAYTSSRMRRLSPADFNAMLEGNGSCLSENDENIILSRSDIPGGFVIRQEDITLLNEDEKKLKRSVDALTDANSVLEKRERVAAEKASEDAKKKLYGELDEKLNERLEDVGELVEKLPDEINDENAEEYRLLIGAVGFTLCYIKRRCSFLFKRMGGGMLPADDIVTCVSELCEFAGNMGVRCVPYQSIDGETPPDACEIVYDFCFSVLEYAAKHECSELILRFFRKNGEIVMSFIGDGALSGFVFPLKKHSDNIRLESKDLSDAFGLTLGVRFNNAEDCEKGGAE